MAALEMDGRILILDAGLSFPEAEMPGIDLVLPDFEWLRDARRTASKASCSPTATRTTSARCRTCCASSAVCTSTPRAFTLA